MTYLKLISLILCSVVMLYAAPVSALVIDFDDITSHEAGDLVPTSYSGLDWGVLTWAVQSDSLYTSNYGNSYGSPSGEYAAYNYDGSMIVQLSSGAEFDFTGAYFSTFAFDDGFDTAFGLSSIDITILGYNDSDLVGTVSMNLQAQYDWLQVDMLSVDRLMFISGFSDGKYFLMDNLTINESTPVPEPATMLLLGFGLVGVGFFRFKKKLKN